MSSVSPVKKTPTKRPRGGQRQRLRRNVGMVILGENGKILAGLRAHANGDRAWQMPQGGIEGREALLDAAYRELHEETGLGRADVELLREMEGWTVYTLPKEWIKGRRFAGQRQKWFLFKYLGAGTPDVAKAEHREFQALDWVDPAWLAEHVIDFRKPVYRKVFAALLEAGS